MLDYLRQAPLDRLSLGARAKASIGDAGIGLAELRFQGAVNLRLRRDDPTGRAAAAALLGLASLPATNEVAKRAGGEFLIALGPDEWLIAGGDGPFVFAKIKGGLEEHFAAVTDVSENFCTIRLTGPAAATVLQKGCPLDFDAAIFKPGTAAQSHIAKATTIIHRLGAEEFNLRCRRSFAEYLFTWLESAGGEFGVAILKE